MTSTQQSSYPFLTSLVEQYRALPQVEAIALAGSQTVGVADPDSDLDLYIYTQQPIPAAVRATIVAVRAAYAEVDNQFWEPGDEWIEQQTGTKVDVMFRDVAWIEAQLDRVLRQHQASVGYSTCVWGNVRSAHLLYDRDGWFGALQQTAQQPYPEQLRRAIIAKNHPILRTALSSYRQQLKLAVTRGDHVSINHRVAALLASYFDIVYAVNRLPHPGEKRLVARVMQECTTVPDAMSVHVRALLRAAALGGQDVLACVDALVDSLDSLLRKEGVLPEGSYGVGQGG
jgi:hypothetical protein